MRILLAFSIYAGLSTAVLASSQAPFDGTWNVTVHTKAGSCDPTASYTVTVAEGKVSGPANVSGTVHPSGNVRVSIGPAYATGELEGNTGSGRWNAASGGAPCSGVWQASKQ